MLSTLGRPTCKDRPPGLHHPFGKPLERPCLGTLASAFARSNIFGIYVTHHSGEFHGFLWQTLASGVRATE